MEIYSTDQAHQILKSLSLNRTAGFAGIGIVFYQDLKKVSHIELGHSTVDRPHLPIYRVEEIIFTLVSVADISSPWHDGFHFICSNPVSLTHLSQFIAPSLQLYDSTPLRERPSGARHMTAALVSNSTGVDCVGLLTSNGEISIFRNGVVELKELVV